MTDLTSLRGKAATMTSIELLELVNHARAEFGESPVRHNDFVARCRDELDGEYYESFVVKQEGPGRPPEALRLTRDQCELVAMRESKGVRRAVRDRLRALEANALPDISSHEGALLALQGAVQRQLVLISENKQLVAERDHAVKTKAQIGSRREAQAMAKASSAVRQVQRLNDELGHGTRFATVTAVEIAAGEKFPINAYVPLRKWCQTYGIQPEDVPDRRYGKVKAWPAAAWLAVYGIDLKFLFGASGAQA
ncbi:hypothetical protein OD800_04415 [Pseudomonas aeruginosa]|uniref:hypothetical protein n=1 Tax=Pseudomonas aeruginosa TaxID=287 RepID=UPI001CD2C406|nr:hypothetical protein [Pseudomonas aeruginosa]MCV0233882.1 hypothetical protein [Pseudomonas aeruginosa]MCV4154848.1 hypothetical protein [Pseudomonas aeruginosa]MDY1056636.1 hypothetical protein [Pseudomonas aeruginosa]HBO2173203.1 hypothetical protein [Pseudomonas aeruginosa]HCF1643043.1 hypothetical protein [Pseudomonas aeruginosa]